MRQRPFGAVFVWFKDKPYCRRRIASDRSFPGKPCLGRLQLMLQARSDSVLEVDIIGHYAIMS